MYVRRFLSSFSAYSDYHSINTRNKNKLVFYETKTKSKTFLENSIRFYNTLSENITDMPGKILKNPYKVESFEKGIL